jgi:hypothetical protein
MAARPLDESTTVASTFERAVVVDSIVKRFQGQQGWTFRYVQKLNGLTDARLNIAERAASLQELDSLFVESPFGEGARLGAVLAERRGNVTLMPGTAVPKDTPGGSPSSFDDLVFTAVAPCRIYDSRFTTSPVDGTAGAPWPVGVTRTIRVGPYVDYSTQGGQATACLGSLGGTGEVAAVLGSVSTVLQTGQGYLVMFSAGAASPNPYGVVQYYQPGYVQTSFLVMSTDLIDPVWSQGVSYQASTHVIVDVVGYFARPKAAALDCTNVTSASVPIAAGGNASAFAPSCAAGYTGVAIMCTTDSYLAWTATNNEPNGCAYHNSAGTAQSISATRKCCRTAGR